jgi:hypothetical protein
MLDMSMLLGTTCPGILFSLSSKLRIFIKLFLFGRDILLLMYTRHLLLTGGLDQPIQRPYIERDWRFGHYEMEGLQDPLSRLSRCFLRPFSIKSKRKDWKDDTELILQPLT